MPCLLLASDLRPPFMRAEGTRGATLHMSSHPSQTLPVHGTHSATQRTRRVIYESIRGCACCSSTKHSRQHDFHATCCITIPCFKSLKSILTDMKMKTAQDVTPITLPYRILRYWNMEQNNDKSSYL